MAKQKSVEDLIEDLSQGMHDALLDFLSDFFGGKETMAEKYGILGQAAFSEAGGDVSVDEGDEPVEDDEAAPFKEEDDFGPDADGDVEGGAFDDEDFQSEPAPRGGRGRGRAADTFEDDPPARERPARRGREERPARRSREERPARREREERPARGAGKKAAPARGAGKKAAPARGRRGR